MLTRETDRRAGIQWVECDCCGEQSDTLPLYEATLDPSKHECSACAGDGCECAS
jgi:hypothetical protein